MWNQLPIVARGIVVIGGAVSGAIGLRKVHKHITRKKVFISFAIEDKGISELMAGQASNEKTPFEFSDMSVKKAWSNAWKTQCRERIKACDGVIVLVSKNTFQAKGVHWEIKCAKEEGLPVRAIYAHKNAKGCRLPAELNGQRIYKWSWQNINNFVKELK